MTHTTRTPAAGGPVTHPGDRSGDRFSKTGPLVNALRGTDGDRLSALVTSRVRTTHETKKTVPTRPPVTNPQEAGDRWGPIFVYVGPTRASACARATAGMGGNREIGPPTLKDGATV